MKKALLALGLLLTVIPLVACGGNEGLPLEDEKAIVLSRLGEGTALLQLMAGPNTGERFYLVCQPDHSVAIYGVYVNGTQVIVDDKPTVSWEKGSKFLNNKSGIVDVACNRAVAVAQITPEPTPPAP
ncbi:MAG: hypothetical protein Q8P35_02000 [Candidatus Yanofskybacteria bacterium]|nr:hypothetical protein [Candidatus Yanofskybacteria bacterium]